MQLDRVAAVLAVLMSHGLIAQSAAAAPEAWTPLSLGGNDLRVVAISPTTPGLILAGGLACHRSTDAGASWAAVAGPADVHVLAFSSSGSTVWAGCWGGGAYRSTNGGATWEQRNTGLLNLVVRSIAVSPINENRVFATTEHSLFETTNGGVSWTPRGPTTYTSAVAISPADPSVVVVGNNQGLLYSSDSGASWTPRSIPGVPSGDSPQWIALDPGNRDVLYVSYQGHGGTFVSTDAGVTWAAITPGIEGFSVAVHAARPGLVYAVGGWSPPVRSGQYGLDVWNSMATAWNPGWFARGIGVDALSGSVYAVSPQGGVARWDPDVAAPANGITDLAAQLVPAGVTLSWTPPGGDVVRFRIYRSPTSGSHPLGPIAAVHGAAGSWTDTSAPGGTPSHYVVEVVDAADNSGPLSNEVSATPGASIDLGLSYIDRLPRDTRRYRVEYSDYSGTGVPHLVPGSEGDKRWPSPGETVTFEAHVINKGNTASGPFDCVWRVNGVPAETDRVAGGVSASSEVTVQMSFVWPSGFDNDHSDLAITLEVDTGAEVPETYETNNSLTDHVQGLSIYFYTDQATYDALDQRLNLVQTHSFEDWLHAQFTEMNNVFQRSTYPGATTGARERVRLARLVVGAPPPSDNTEDGDWYLTGGGSYAESFAHQVDQGLIHELMHQLGLIDLYNMNLEIEQNRVLTPDGVLTGMTFDWARPGIMGGGSIEPHTGLEHYLSRWDVLAINSNCGYRRGYYGEFLYDLPQTIAVEIRDVAGNPASGVQVRIFQREASVIDNTPDIVGTTDTNGRFVLPNRPVAEATTTATGHELRANPFGTINVVGVNANWLIEVSRGSDDFDHAWLTLADANLAFWDGAASQWTHTIHSRLASGPVQRVEDLRLETRGDAAFLSWSPIGGATSYTVYRASKYLDRIADPSHEFENWRYRPIATVTDPHHLDTSLDESSRYVVAGHAGSLAGPLSNRAFAPRYVQPRDVILLADGRRMVLDPQNGYSLIVQDAAGTPLANVGSVHNHVELSNFMSLDPALGRLVISHPGDFYTGRQSVKVTDLEANVLLEIGDTGSSPGLLQQPTGVAVDASSRILVADNGNSRLQLFRSDGSFVSAFGVPGAGVGAFNNMRGVAVDGAGRVFVCDAGNHRVAILQLAGDALSWIGELPGIADPVCVAIGLAGELFVSDAGTDAVLVYDAGLDYVRSLNVPVGYFGGALLDPSGLAVLDATHVLVCDTGNRRMATLRIDGTTNVPSVPGVPGRLALRHPVPSPFNDATVVTFEVPAAAECDLSVFDVTGRRVRRLISGRTKGGVRAVRWDGTDEGGRAALSGVYFIRLESAGRVVSQRVIRFN